jgi:putative colanic acid biosynthesis UDP-glucose lipid carrier transferase
MRKSRHATKGAASVWIITFLCLVVVVFALKVDDLPPGGNVLLFFAAGLIGIAFLRWGMNRALVSLSRTERLTKRQVVVISRSGYPVPVHLVHAIRSSGRNVRGIFSLPARYDESVLSECMREIVDFVRQESLDEILLAIDWFDTTLIDQITEKLRVVPLRVVLVPDHRAGPLLENPLLEFGGTRGIELQQVPLTRPQLAAKRLLDLVVTVLALPLVLSISAIFAALIVLDSPGPVFFRQRRMGFNNCPFYIYKFRTMKTQEDGSVIRQASRADERVTRVGWFLRRFSIDELPQLINVIKGEMSLVGPRPHALAHDNEYGQIVISYAARHNVKPGITGWAQVNGWRGGTPEAHMMVRRVEHDLWYIDHWSLWLDIKILMLTPLGLCNAQNAY